MTTRGLVVPAYFHPAVAGPGWRILAGAGTAVRAVILNVADGPGPSFEAELTAAAVRTGRPLLGYVDTDYGARPADAVRADLDRYRAWYPTSGVFFDRVATGRDMLPWYERLVRYARAIDAATVVLNHGAYPDEGYAAIADALVTFEGPYAAHRRVVIPPWARLLSCDMFWHLVYGTPARCLTSALDHAAACNVGVVYVTDRAGANPWDGLPEYFTTQADTWTR